MKKYSKEKRIIEFIIGCFLIAVSYNVFIAPNKIIPGGTGGIAIILNNLFGINNSAFIFIANIFLLILSYFLLGIDRTKNTFLGSILFPIFVHLTEDINVWLKIDISNVLLSTLLGGLIFGFGIGLVFRAGFSVGGTDTINFINNKYFKITIGKSILLVDGMITLCSGIFLGLNSLMYSIILIYLISYISDRVVLGISDSKIFYIITNEEDKVEEYITKVLGHGVTILKGTGGFAKERENVIMTVLPTKQYYQLKEGIKEIDKNAFYIITDTYEVYGGE